MKDPDVEADFARIRERDGIRQLTAKGKDKGNNLDRLEVDVDSTSEFEKSHKLFTSFFGKEAGKIHKTYYVYWVSKSEHTNISCYSVDNHDYTHTIVEVETTSMDKMLHLETQVTEAFRSKGVRIERAPGSLYEMFIHPGVCK